MTNPNYLLGHSAFELERFARQERIIGPRTRDYFHYAGILPGMRVLDVGSGTGVVAFFAAEVVGPSGEVIGTDLAPTAVATANEAAAARGLAQVAFREGNPAEMSSNARSMRSSAAMCCGARPIPVPCCAGSPSICVRAA